jgi:hypothetical protein
MPTSKVINRLIFMSSRSIALGLAAIARSQDFAVLLKSRWDSLFRSGGFTASGHLQCSAITLSSDPANSSAAKKDKEGLFLFDGYFGWSFRIKGMVARALSDIAFIPVQ